VVQKINSRDETTALGCHCAGTVSERTNQTITAANKPKRTTFNNQGSFRRTKPSIISASREFYHNRILTTTTLLCRRQLILRRLVKYLQTLPIVERLLSSGGTACCHLSNIDVIISNNSLSARSTVQKGGISCPKRLAKDFGYCQGLLTFILTCSSESAKRSSLWTAVVDSRLGAAVIRIRVLQIGTVCGSQI
jgi:hypothetical protein